MATTDAPPSLSSPSSVAAPAVEPDGGDGAAAPEPEAGASAEPTSTPESTPAPTPMPEPEPEPEPEPQEEAEPQPEPQGEANAALRLPPAARNPRALLPPLRELPPPDDDDILPELTGEGVLGAFDTDTADVTDQSEFVYVQHPTTKKLSRQRNDSLLQDQARKTRQQRTERLDSSADDWRRALWQIERAISTVFMLCQALLAGVAVVTLIVIVVPDDFLAYYAPLALPCYRINMFLATACVLGACEKHSRDARTGWDTLEGASYSRSLCVVLLYCCGFLLALFSARIDDSARALPVAGSKF